MTHKFTVRQAMTGVSLHHVRQLAARPDFHEAVTWKLPGTDKQILKSALAGQQYSIHREYNLEVNIPDLAKKFLKDAFRMRREDEWNLADMSCRSRFGMNMPAEFVCKMVMTEEDGQVVVSADWEVEVRVPLIHGVLAKHAEGEIRRFSQIELDIIQGAIQAEGAR